MIILSEKILKSLVKRKKIKDEEGNTKGVVFIPNKKR